MMRQISSRWSIALVLLVASVAAILIWRGSDISPKLGLFTGRVGESQLAAVAGAPTNHGVHFYQIRQGSSSRSDTPLPISNGQTLAEFTISLPYGNLPLYAYYDLQTLNGHLDAYVNSTSASEAGYYQNWIVELSDAEAVAAFSGQSQIPLSLLQVADIQKVYQRLHPGPDLPLGVILSSSGSYQADPATPQSDYLAGNTMLLPVGNGNNRPLLNMENDAVREYQWRLAQKQAQVAGTNKLFLDNFLFRYPYIGYLPGNDDQDKVQRFAGWHNEFLAKMKSLGYALVVNGVYFHVNKASDDPYYDYFRNGFSLNNFDGVMYENRWNGYGGYGPTGRLNPDYIADTQTLNSANKMVLFSTNDVSLQSGDAYRVWLYAHLLAGPKPYFFINTSAGSAQIDYPGLYDTPLGVALDPAPVWSATDGTWSRRYPAGTIVFTPPTSSNSSGTISLVSAPSVDLKINGDDNPADILASASASISWTSAGVTSCTASRTPSGGWSGTKGTSGLEQTEALAVGNYTFSIACTGPGGQASDSVDLGVLAADAVSVSLKAEGEGGTATVVGPDNPELEWSSTNAATCTASGSWTGAKATSGSETIPNPGIGSYTYTLTCVGTTGQASDSVTITYQAQPGVSTLGLTANGQSGTVTVSPSSQVTLAWTGSSVESCRASGGWSGAKDVSGSEIITASETDGTTTYTLRCRKTTSNSSLSSTVKVTVSSSAETLTDNTNPNPNANTGCQGNYPQLVGPFGFGVRGEQVAVLQRMLATYFNFNINVVVNSVYDQLTQRMVQRFQEQQGLPATGVAGPLTREALNARFACGVTTSNTNNSAVLYQLYVQLLSLLQQLLGLLQNP